MALALALARVLASDDADTDCDDADCVARRQNAAAVPLHCTVWAGNNHMDYALDCEHEHDHDCPAEVHGHGHVWR